jgi:hypothetical protein
MAKESVIGLKNLLVPYDEADGEQAKKLLNTEKFTEKEAFEVWDFIPKDADQGLQYAFLNNPSLTSNLIGYVWNLYIDTATENMRYYNYILIASETKKVPLSVIKASFDKLLEKKKNQNSLVAIVHNFHHQGILDDELKNIILSLPESINGYGTLIEQVAKDSNTPIEPVVLKAVEGSIRCQNAMRFRSDDVFAYARTVSDAFDEVELPESWMYKAIGWDWMNA